MRLQRASCASSSCRKRGGPRAVRSRRRPSSASCRSRRCPRASCVCGESGRRRSALPHSSVVCHVVWLPSRAQRAAVGCLVPFTQHGLEPRDVAADHPQAERFLQRLGRAAELQPEQLLLELRDARPGCRQASVRGSRDGFSHSVCASSRAMNFDFTEILAAASAIAFCAISLRDAFELEHHPARLHHRHPRLPAIPCLCPCGFRPASS